MYEFNPVKTKDACVQWIRDYFTENGKGCHAVIGISGGKDSSVTAALCAEALGKNQVLGVLMPHGNQADIEDSYQLCRHLGIDYMTIDIGTAFRSIKHQIKAEMGDRWSAQSGINLGPRLRMSTLYAAAQTIRGRVANTCNLSEDWVGYSTLFGDLAGDFSPLGLLTVEEVKRIGLEALNLPKNLVEKTPADGLCGKTDEDNLGFSYQTEDDYLRRGIVPEASIKERIDTLHKDSAFKREVIRIPVFDPNIPILAA